MKLPKFIRHWMRQRAVLELEELLRDRIYNWRMGTKNPHVPYFGAGDPRRKYRQQFNATLPRLLEIQRKYPRICTEISPDLLREALEADIMQMVRSDYAAH